MFRHLYSLEEKVNQKSERQRILDIFSDILLAELRQNVLLVYLIFKVNLNAGHARKFNR